MQNVEPLTRFICDTILMPKDIDLVAQASQFDLGTLLRRASHNRVLYLLVQNLLYADLSSWEPTLCDVLFESRKPLAKLADTLAFLSATLPTVGIDYLVVKTYKYIPYVTFDVDVLVRPEQFEHTKQVFAEKGLSILRHPGESFRKQSNCEREDLLRIDLHQGFYWQESSYLDEDLVWEQPVHRRVGTIEMPTPSLEIEVLLNIAHLLYERRYLTLLDLIYFREAVEEGCRWEMIEARAQEYGWKRSLDIFRSIFDALIEQVWGLEATGPKIELPVQISLPYMIPLRQVWGFFIEKIQATRTIPWFDVAYYHFATGRYYLTGRARLPFYLHWYPMDKLSRS